MCTWWNGFLRHQSVRLMCLIAKEAVINRLTTGASPGPVLCISHTNDCRSDHTEICWQHSLGPSNSGWRGRSWAISYRSGGAVLGDCVTVIAKNLTCLHFKVEYSWWVNSTGNYSSSFSDSFLFSPSEHLASLKQEQLGRSSFVPCAIGRIYLHSFWDQWFCGTCDDNNSNHF